MKYVIGAQRCNEIVDRLILGIVRLYRAARGHQSERQLPG
jgi:hypothetical protein